MILRIFAMSIGLLAATGCGKKKIDASTDVKMTESIAVARAELPEAERGKFDEALTALTFSKIDLSGAFSGKDGATAAKEMTAKIREEVNGKTAEQIIQKGQEIVEARRSKERVEAAGEMAELRRKKAEAEAAKAALASFRVTRARFYVKKERIMKHPIIELSLLNETKVAVSRAYFVGTLASPGRSVPWIKDDFNHSIAGGIEPGETKELTLDMNMFSEWGSDEIPADAVLTVEVTRINGPDEKAVFDTEGFSEFHATRLESLEKAYAK